jgi:hypothetical protein
MNGNDIGWAVHMMREGHTVRRAGWNGKGMWIALSGREGKMDIPAIYFWSEKAREYAMHHGGYATVLPCIIMKTATGEILMGWLASQTDLLADDWELAT